MAVGARLSCPLSEANLYRLQYVGDRAGVRSTEFGSVLSSEVSNVLV